MEMQIAMGHRNFSPKNQEFLELLVQMHLKTVIGFCIFDVQYEKRNTSSLTMHLNLRYLET